MIEVNNISYHYHGGKDVLKDVSFALEQGQFLAILGNNGVGKSTLLKCLNKILRADSGQVLLDGENILQMSNHQVSRRMAFVAQTVPSTQMTVHDVVMLGRRPYMKFGFTEKDHQIVHSAMDWQERWPSSRSCCCWMNQPAVWTFTTSIRCCKLCRSFAITTA